MPTPSNVLIIDDEPHVGPYITMLIQSALGAAVEVKHASSRDEAIAVFSATKPELVLLDINLIGTNGFEVMRQLREIDPAVAVVMLTSVSTRNVVERAAAEGANGYLLKNKPHEELAASLKELIVELFDDEAE